MDEFDFTDALKIVLVSIFMLGSIQLHAVIDESSQHGADRAEAAGSVSASQRAVERRDELDDAGEKMRASALST